MAQRAPRRRRGMGRVGLPQQRRPFVVPDRLHPRLDGVECPVGRSRLPGVRERAAAGVLGGPGRRHGRRDGLLHGDDRAGRARHGGVHGGPHPYGDRRAPARQRTDLLRGRRPGRPAWRARHRRPSLVGARVRPSRVPRLPQLPGAHGPPGGGARARPADVQRAPVRGEGAGNGHRGQRPHHAGAGRAHPGVFRGTGPRAGDGRTRGPGGEDGGPAARHRQPGGARPRALEARPPHLRRVRTAQETPAGRRGHHRPGPVPAPGCPAGAVAPRAMGRPRLPEGSPG